jgi:hypothetical protein
MVGLPYRGDRAGAGNIGFPPRFVTSQGEQDESVAAADEVDSVAQSIIDPQLVQTAAERPRVAEIADRSERSQRRNPAILTMATQGAAIAPI